MSTLAELLLSIDMDLDGAKRFYDENELSLMRANLSRLVASANLILEQTKQEQPETPEPQKS